MTEAGFFKELIRRRDSIFATDLLISAVGYMDFFNRLNEEPSDLKSLCRNLKIAERPADVMLTFFSSLQLIKKHGSKYIVTEHGRRFFIKGSKSDLSGYFNSLLERPVCRDILNVLRTDSPMNWAYSPKGKEWARAMSKKKFAGSFTAAMDSRGSIMAPVLAGKLDCNDYNKLLDIAGASGIYSCEIVRRYPNLRAAVLEKNPVDIMAKKAIIQQGFSKKISVISGDMFSSAWPKGFDIHLMSHVLHDWDAKSVRFLLRKSYESIMPDGLIVIHDVHINGKKTGPLAAAEYSVLLMLSTRGKCYSVAEMKDMLSDAGFADIHCMPTTAFRSVITARKLG